FNETFHDLFRRPPSALRRKGSTDLPTGSVAGTGVTLRLRYRPPYYWAAMLAHLAARAVDGVEELAGSVYRRTVSFNGQLGTVEVGHEPAHDNLTVMVRFPCLRALPVILSRVRRVFDTGADIEAIAAHLARDAILAPLVASRPGLRVPGGWDGFELAVRAVLGQQVSVAAARRLAGRLVGLCGDPLPAASRPHPTLTHAFPSPERIAAADLGGLGVPLARRTALQALAAAALADPYLFRPSATVEDAIARLRTIPGIGAWTA